MLMSMYKALSNVPCKQQSQTRYILFSTTKKFGLLFLSSSPTPPSKNPVHVSCKHQ